MEQKIRKIKISYLKEKLIFTAAYLAVVGVWWWLGLPCIYTALLGVVCPGCGMTRAMLAVLRLDLAAAFSFHPMFWTMPILYLYFLVDGGLFRRKAVDAAVLIAIGGGFLANWLCRILT